MFFPLLIIIINLLICYFGMEIVLVQKMSALYIKVPHFI